MGQAVTISPSVRLFIRDAIEAALAGVATIFFVPESVDDTKRLAVAAAVAIVTAVVAVARRELLPIILNAISPNPPAQ